MNSGTICLIADVLWFFVAGSGVYLCRRATICTRLRVYDQKTRLKWYLISVLLVVIPTILLYFAHRVLF